MEFAGWRPTFDLTVEDANHYITRSGLINCQTHIAFDELTQFNKEQYDQITTRVRTSDPVLRRMLRRRAMSNPLMRRDKGDAYSVDDPKWVQKYFVNPCPEGNKILVKVVKRRDGRTVRRTRIYVPATLYDNPNKEFVDDYEASLLDKPLHIRKALLEGDWDVTPDSFFAHAWDKQVHVIQPYRVFVEERRFFRSMDWGFVKPGCVHWWAIDDDERLECIRELTVQGKDAKEVAQLIKGVELNLDLWSERRNCSRIPGVADTQLWEKRGDVAKSKAAVMLEHGVPWRPADKGPGSRQANAERILTLLMDHRHHTQPPGIMFFDTCRELIRTLPGIQTNPHNVAEPQDGGEDHWLDSAMYAVSFASRGLDHIPMLEDDDDFEEEVAHATVGQYGYGSEVC